MIGLIRIRGFEMAYNDIGSLEKDLERILGFIGNCDSKSSVVLGAVLAAVSLLIGLGAPNIGQAVYEGDIFYKVAIIFGYSVSMVVFVIGIANLFLALRATVERAEILGSEKINRSLLFFGDISDMSFGEYRDNVSVRGAGDYTEDLMSQIYVNSKICGLKYRRYNNGLLLSSIGLLMLLVCTIAVCIV